MCQCFILKLAGRYCAHEETAQSGAVAMNCDSNLQDYLDTLSVSCQGDKSEAAILTWTPDQNTPDVVYYQVSHILIFGVCYFIQAFPSLYACKEYNYII